MAIVIDASVMGARLLPDEENADVAEAVLEELATEQGIVPALFWYEIRNVLLQAMRRKRIDRQELGDCLVRLTDEFALEVDDEHDEARTVALAERHGLSMYDAAYLELAERRGAKLATFDGSLGKAAAQERIENPAEGRD